jgi:hypothetical protein
MLLHPEKLVGVHPDLKEFAEWAASVLPFDLLVVEGYRTDDRQKALYAQGRTAPGPIVTNAKDAKESAHGVAAAVDFAVSRNGVVDWNDRDAYALLGALAKDFGLVWGGNFSWGWDGGHVELSDWRTLTAGVAAAGRRAGPGLAVVAVAVGAAYLGVKKWR